MPWDFSVLEKPCILDVSSEEYCLPEFTLCPAAVPEEVPCAEAVPAEVPPAEDVPADTPWERIASEKPCIRASSAAGAAAAALPVFCPLSPEPLSCAVLFPTEMIVVPEVCA